MSIGSVTIGTLYVVATPIGNLADISERARQVLAAVAVIAAEDTRHSGQLLKHLAISTPMLALHEHNERQASQGIIERLQRGEDVALISDAGTPLLSDPGYLLVGAAHQAGIRVSPIPGASAMLSALSAAGLATDRFVFEGFLPARAGPRRSRLEALQHEPRTIVYYEAPHRLLESLQDMLDIFGAGRPAVLARELTKIHETIRLSTLGELTQWAADDANQQRGEAVILIGGAETTDDEAIEAERVLNILLKELPVKQAAALASEISGAKRNTLYKKALELAEMTENE